MEHTTWTTPDGTAHPAIMIAWAGVESVLGREYDGAPEDDGRLVAHLLDEGAPAWIEDASGGVDEEGWYLYREAKTVSR